MAERVNEIKHHKLVRDKIPAEIEARGAFCTFTHLSPEARLAALANKIVEEAMELRAEILKPGSDRVLDRAETLAELADIHDALYTVQIALGFTTLEVTEAISQKTQAKGRLGDVYLLRSWEAAK